MLVEDDGLNRFWDDPEERTAGNPSEFDDRYLDHGEDNMEERATKSIEESWLGDDRVSMSEVGKEIQ
jgi:hypothetical protein